jgi:regulator of protease activity HflC (stomatin/prohibitin superfamily)
VRLKGKVRYQPIGFELLPPKFTLSQLQHLYEAVLETELDKRNFRKKVLSFGLLVPLKETQMAGRHRPAQLFRFEAERYQKLFGIRFIKVQPTTYLLQYRRGQIIREGVGLSFFYYAPTTSLVAIPVGSIDVPFIFEEPTGDYQTVTLQGQVSYRVVDAKKLAGLMDFTLAPNGRDFASEDPEKLPQRVINLVHVLARAELEKLALRDAIRAAAAIVQQVKTQLTASGEVAALGLEILGLSLLAIKPTPETARALEAETREQLLKEADEAIYARRNSAVEQERAIKENELNTEIAVENKKRQIRETQMDAERAVQEKRHQLERADLDANTGLEAKRKELVALAAANAKAEADARAYGISTTMQALSTADTKILQALASTGMKPEQLIAFAFQELAGKADKIGQLNISPDLLRELLDRKATK